MEKSMAFPPEFSSTLTYANRYDLDEIDVFLEGNSSNPMFFDISGFTCQWGTNYRIYFHTSLFSIYHRRLISELELIETLYTMIGFYTHRNTWPTKS